MDIVHTWEYVRKLCLQLQAVPRLQQLSIIFLENEFASWSHAGQLRDSMGLDNAEQDDISEEDDIAEEDEENDITHVLYNFDIVRNVARAAIQLPMSVRDDESWIYERECSEAPLQAIPRPKYLELLEWMIQNLERQIHSSSYCLLKATANISRLRLRASCKDGKVAHTE